MENNLTFIDIVEIIFGGIFFTGFIAVIYFLFWILMG